VDAGRPPGGRAVHHPRHLPPPRRGHHRVVVAGASQACVAALARLTRTRARLVGSGAGVVVDWGPLRRRVQLLPDRPVPGVRRARWVGRRRDGVLRRLGLLHLGGRAPVPRDLQCRPWTGRRRAPAAAPPARLRAATDRLVEQCAPVRRHAVVQRGHLPGDADGPRAAVVRPAGLETGRRGIGVLPRLGLSRVRRGLRWSRVPTTPQPRVADRSRQPCRMRRLRDLGHFLICRPRDRRRRRPGRGQRLHGTRCALLPRRSGTPAARIRHSGLLMPAVVTEPAPNQRPARRSTTGAKVSMSPSATTR
jgi:hypothetical protein